MKTKGFTITEVTILIVVVAIFLSALLPLIVKNMVANNKSRTRRTAYEAANEKMEEVRSQSFDSIVSGSFQVPAVFGGSGQITVNHDINGNGQVESDENNIAEVTVNVSYQEQSQTKSISISTLITSGGVSN